MYDILLEKKTNTYMVLTIISNFLKRANIVYQNLKEEWIFHIIFNNTDKNQFCEEDLTTYLIENDFAVIIDKCAVHNSLTISLTQYTFKLTNSALLRLL